MEKQIRYYYDINNNCPYLDWYNKLDKSLQLRVDKRIDKLKSGVYGDSKPLQKSELSEIRMDFGKGLPYLLLRFRRSCNFIYWWF